MLHKFIESPLWVLLVLLSTVGKAQKITETEKQSKVSQGEKLRRDWWMIHIFKSFSSVISILFLEEKKKKKVKSLLCKRNQKGFQKGNKCLGS